MIARFESRDIGHSNILVYMSLWLLLLCCLRTLCVDIYHTSTFKHSLEEAVHTHQTTAHLPAPLSMMMTTTLQERRNEGIVT